MTGYLGPSRGAVLVDRVEKWLKHQGPGSHPGTGTPQSVHGGGGRQRETTPVETSDPAYTGLSLPPKAIQRLRAFEAQFRDADVEHLHVVGPTGRVLAEAVGDAQGVSFDFGSEAAVQAARGGVGSHNHPARLWSGLSDEADTSFSPLDVRQGLALGLAEIRVVNKYAIYRMGPNASGEWPLLGLNPTHAGSERGVFQSILNEARIAYDLGRITKVQAQEAFHRAWETLAKQGGYRYERIPHSSEGAST